MPKTKSSKTSSPPKLVTISLAAIIFLGAGVILFQALTPEGTQFFKTPSDTASPAPPTKLPQCSDTKDNDLDELTDYPNDPGCSGASDNDEYNAPTGKSSTNVKLLIGDFINREIMDRDKGSKYYPMNVPETDPNANPFTNGNSTALHTALEQTQIYKIKGSSFGPMNDYVVTDPEVGIKYIEKQDMWLWGNVRYTESNNDVISDLRLMSYTMKFNGATDQLGIPVCTKVRNTLYASCMEKDKTANHNVKIRFLGQEWVITDMQPSTTDAATETIVRSGGSIKLTKGSQVLNLVSGQELNPGVGDNKEWRVVLGWKNKGASSSDTAPDHLRTIILYTTDTQNLIDDELSKGDFVSIVQDPANWKLTYNGLNISSSDRDTLKFQLERSSTRRNLEVLYGSTSILCNVTAPYVLVTSATTTAFKLNAGYGPLFYVGSSGISCANGITFARNSVLITSSTTATGMDKYIAQNYSKPIHVTYGLIGDGSASWASGGVITITDPIHTNPTMLPGIDFDGTKIPNVRTYFVISEKAGVGVSSSSVDRIMFSLRNNVSTSSSWTLGFNFEQGKVLYYYAGPVVSIPVKEGAASNQKSGFITERGTIVNTVMDDNLLFGPAKKLITAGLTLSEN